MKTALSSLFLLGALVASSHAGDDNKTVTRIAFGSCVHQDDPQPIWDAVILAKPNVFLMLGDSIYHDVFRNKKGKDETLEQKYAKAKSVPGFQKLLQSCPLLGCWDDHDYGVNDAGSEYPFKKEAQQAFLDYLGVPRDSPRRTQEGIYHAQIFGPADKRLQIIVLDARYFRGPRRNAPNSRPERAPTNPISTSPRPFLERRNGNGWLHSEVPARVRLLVSSIQVVPQDHHHEKWMNLPLERERLYQLIHDTGASGVVVLSGDRHLAELSMMDAGIGYPLYDLTSSGLTMGFKGWRPLETNRHRVATMNTGNNFGLVTIDWEKTDPLIRLQIRDEQGEVTIQEKVKLSTLQPGKWKSKGTGWVRLADGKLLTPELVKEHLNKEITLEMDVHATGQSKTADLVFLNSSPDRSSEENFTIVLDAKGQASLKKAGITDPRLHFEGKSVRVSGTLSLFRERPQIIVSEASQIRAVGK